jgi:hypothetical protein
MQNHHRQRVRPSHTTCHRRYQPLFVTLTLLATGALWLCVHEIAKLFVASYGLVGTVVACSVCFAASLIIDRR